MSTRLRRLSHEPDFDEFLKILWRKGKPRHLPFYEHLASPGFIGSRTGTEFPEMRPGDEGYWEIYVDFWLGMGYDCVPMEMPLKCPLPRSAAEGLSVASESSSIIRTWMDFESYAWPGTSEPIDFGAFETVAGLLPPGVRIVGGVAMGPYEWVSRMMGVVGLSYALADDPSLVDAVFAKINALIKAAHDHLATMDAVGALRQGDDLGFKTSTFLSPEALRRYVLPAYRDIAASAHDQGKPFILHSCGNLSEIHEDLIDFCRIDAKHSFEDGIMSVMKFKQLYGSRITPLGGLDVDVICRSDRESLKEYTRKHIDACFEDGWWALGTGNSLTDYMPVENYITVLEEGRRYTS